MGGTSGISWSDGEAANYNMAGITGGSAFQDYSISDIKARRDICIYGCCPDPFPTLIYTIRFERSNYFYQMKLFVPSISITLVSFISFWLDPLVGERLSFGIAVILAVTMNDVVATSMMPVTSSTLLMDYVSMICLIFAIISLFETGLVLNLYHRTDRNWFHALMPVGGYRIYREIIRKLRRMRTPVEGRPSDIPPAEVPTSRRGVFRLQLYREIFYSLDKNHSGELELMEVETFAMSVLGFDVGENAVLDALDKFDFSNNGRLNFDEFVSFCETNIENKDDINHLTKLLRGYVKAFDRELITIREMWKGRAVMIDTVCRFSVPLGFFISLAVTLTKDEEALKDIMKKDGRSTQWLVKTSGLFVTVFFFVAYVLYWCYRKVTREVKISTIMPQSHGFKDAFKPCRSAAKRTTIEQKKGERNLSKLEPASGSGESTDASKNNETPELEAGQNPDGKGAAEATGTSSQGVTHRGSAESYHSLFSEENFGADSKSPQELRMTKGVVEPLSREEMDKLQAKALEEAKRSQESATDDRGAQASQGIDLEMPNNRGLEAFKGIRIDVAEQKLSDAEASLSALRKEYAMLQKKKIEESEMVISQLREEYNAMQEKLTTKDLQNSKSSRNQVWLN